MSWMNPILSGFSGVLLPYSIRTDDLFTFVLVGVFFLYAFLYMKCRKYLLYQSRIFFRDRSRSGSFIDAALVDVRYLVALFFLACISIGMTAYNIVMQVFPGLLGLPSPALLLSGLSGGILLYLCFKMLSYLIVGNVFFGRSAVSTWMDSYLLIIYISGIILYPILLMSVFMGGGAVFTIYLSAFLLILAKILIFCKWIKLFFANNESLFFLILYFCALEIIPFFILYRGIEKILVIL